MQTKRTGTNVCHVKIRVVNQFISMSQTDITVVFFISNTATSRHVATLSTSYLTLYQTSVLKNKAPPTVPWNSHDTNARWKYWMSPAISLRSKPRHPQVSQVTLMLQGGGLYVWPIISKHTVGKDVEPGRHTKNSKAWVQEELSA